MRKKHPNVNISHLQAVLLTSCLLPLSFPNSVTVPEKSVWLSVAAEVDIIVMLRSVVSEVKSGLLSTMMGSLSLSYPYM